jgi:uncharacterized protein
MENKYANPAPLGLMGFGMTTILLNIHNAGFFPVTSMVLAMGICYGGIAQVIAGIMDFKKVYKSRSAIRVIYGVLFIPLGLVYLFYVDRDFWQEQGHTVCISQPYYSIYVAGHQGLG